MRSDLEYGEIGLMTFFNRPSLIPRIISFRPYSFISTVSWYFRWTAKPGNPNCPEEI